MLIIKKIFNYNFGSEIYLSGSFYNRLKFSINRFSSSLEIVSASIKQDVRNKINAHIKNSLELEGYNVNIKEFKGQYKIEIQTDDILTVDDGSENENDSPIVINLNYFNTEYLFMGKMDESTESFNINKFDVCTRINTIKSTKALTILVRKIIKTNLITPVEFYDLNYFKNLNYNIYREYFSTADQKILLKNLFEICKKIRKEKFLQELFKCAFDYSPDNCSKTVEDKAWIKSFNV